MKTKIMAMAVLGLTVAFASCKKNEMDLTSSSDPFATLSENNPKPVKVKIKKSVANTPISGAKVVLYLASTHAPVDSVYTDANGDGTFSSIAPASYELGASAAGFYPILVPVTVDTVSVEMDLGTFYLDEVPD